MSPVRPVLPCDNGSNKKPASSRKRLNASRACVKPQCPCASARTLSPGWKPGISSLSIRRSRNSSRLAKTLLRWGTPVDLKQVEEAYFNTRVIAPSQYEAAVRLLQIFAGHLAQLGQQVALQNKENEPLPVNKARQWVVAHCEDSVSLAAVAQAVNLSAKYFSDVFRKATGIPFVEYVSRVRVEKAKNLLVNPQLRISEIAFEVGFQSLSQFNRAFRRHAGTSPRDYRHALPGAASPENRKNAQYFR